MNQFLTILSLYYLCDSTLAMRPMAGSEAENCARAAQEVRVWFAPAFDLAPSGSLAHDIQMLEGYAAFKAWEESNPDLIAALKSDADSRAGRAATVAASAFTAERSAAAKGASLATEEG